MEGSHGWRGIMKVRKRKRRLSLRVGSLDVCVCVCKQARCVTLAFDFER